MQITLTDNNGNSLTCNAMPDSGTSRTIIAKRILTQANFQIDASRKSRIRAANSSSLDCAGSAILQITFDSFSIKTDALISSNLAEDVLISYYDLVQLGVLPKNFPARNYSNNTNTKLVTETVNTSCPDDDIDLEMEIDKLTEEYKHVFDDAKVTPMSGKPMVIHLNRSHPDYRPLKTTTARKVPLHFQAEAEKTLQWYIDSGVIERVPDSETTEWCSPGFFVPKPNGKVRLVVDYREINRFIERPVHPFPSPRDIIKDIKPNSKYFLKLDASQGYYQLPLAEESKDLTTFLLPSGRYRYCRAPMGLSPSSDGFCNKTDFILSPVPDLLKIVDDALLQAPTKQILLSKLKIALECCSKHNFTMRRDKLKAGREITFAGYTIGQDGVKPDPKRISAITDFPVPADISQVRGFLGLCNQLGFFVPDLSHATKPIRDLLKKDVEFQWLKPQNDAFIKAKAILTSPLIVQCFDPSLQTELLTDAARLGGLGYALIQRNKDDTIRLIQCGSRSLSSPETRYATNELEALAIHYAISDCHFYLYGCKFTVITDHKPLLGTFCKCLHDISNARLLRIREKLTEYNFELVWSPGKTHYIADALSRSPVFLSADDKEVITCNVSLAYAIAEDPALQPFYDAAIEDENYQDIIEVFLQNKHPKDLPPMHPAKLFNQYWDDISIFDDTLLVYQDNRIIVPKALRNFVLEKLHSSHSGISKTRMLAQQTYFWPGISRDISNLIANCEACLTKLPSQHEIVQEYHNAIRPMQAVSLDLFDHAGNDHLVMVDRFSNFLWTARLTKTTTAAVTKTINAWFLEFGYPSTIISDNGPQFRTEFKEYCSTNQIVHLTSSPYNPQSNGLAESAVKAAKHLLSKSDSFNDFKVRLLAWRNVPTVGSTMSPAERFFGHPQRHGLPRLDQAPLPRQPIERDRNLPPLNIGDNVLLQNVLTKQWDDYGVITTIQDSGMSYSVERECGSTIIRNRRFLRLRPADSTLPSSATPNEDSSGGAAVSLRRSPRFQ